MKSEACIFATGYHEECIEKCNEQYRETERTGILQPIFDAVALAPGLRFLLGVAVRASASSFLFEWSVIVGVNHGGFPRFHSVTDLGSFTVYLFCHSYTFSSSFGSIYTGRSFLSSLYYFSPARIKSSYRNTAPFVNKTDLPPYLDTRSDSPD